MADFAQTVANTLDVLGASPPNYWGVMLWGDNWGVSEDLATSYEKWLSPETIVLSDSISKSFNVTLPQTINLTYELDVCKRYEKWCLMWTGPTTNGADAVYDEFTKLPEAP